MPQPSHSEEPLGRPASPIDHILAPLTAFLHVEAASGIVLLIATVIAVSLANSPASAAYMGFWQTELGFRLGLFEVHHSLQHWVNDGLMVIFFFVVGMEVKRELVVGELREMRRALLPLVAALGGMIAPACLYLATVAGKQGSSGWGIPMATDIAFVVGCMAVLGHRVPNGLRVMMLTLAIADDIGAILVIAVGYSHGLSWPWLAVAAALLLVVWFMRLAGIQNFIAYILVGIFVWIAFMESGIHATIAGVILGLMTPARPLVSPGLAQRALDRMRERLTQSTWTTDAARATSIREIHEITRYAISPLEYLVSVLHPWVSFLIMPVFALANAGVRFGMGDIASPIALAVILGLFIGKPLGVFLASFLAVKTRLADLPAGVGWIQLFGGGCLAGIGFTMALFIATLALDSHSLEPAKVGVMAASLLSAIVGSVVLLAAPRQRPTVASSQAAPPGA